VNVALSLFFPMYNERGNIDQAVAAALAALATVSAQYEVIVVDDGSRDRTGAIADLLAAANPRVRVILADGDNQFDLGELPVLVRALEGFDVVSGYRITRRDPPLRRLYAFLYNRLARLLFDIPVMDVNCGFKIYRRDLLQRVRDTPDSPLSTARLFGPFGNFTLRSCGIVAAMKAGELEVT
jgi:glycosyltransferase involved in cell wall biosynthesis